MARDYAQRGNGGRQATTGSATPGWVWMVMGIAIGFAVAAGFYITRPAGPGVEQAAETAAPARPDARKKITVPPKEPSRFTFYELLPNYEVVIPKEALKPDPKGPPATTPGGELYLIQVGSFQERREAESQKARLALLGIESRVEQVTIDNDQTWYRVRIGPEHNMARVHSILAQLDEAEIKALVMRVPQ